jgi:hypothetical protein
MTTELQRSSKRNASSSASVGGHIPTTFSPKRALDQKCNQGRLTLRLCI